MNHKKPSQIRDKELNRRLLALKQYWKEVDGPVALGFSGGVDSGLLLASALRWLPHKVYAFSLISIFVSQRSLSWIMDTARELDIDVIKLHWDPISHPEIAANGPDRCYHCKRYIYSRILAEVEQRGLGCKLVADGTQADDLKKDRPGLKALSELGIATPLAQLGFTKDHVRQGLRAWNLSFWNRPSEACRAVSIPHGQKLTKPALVVGN